MEYIRALEAKIDNLQQSVDTVALGGARLRPTTAPSMASRDPELAARDPELDDVIQAVNQRREATGAQTEEAYHQQVA